MNKKERVKHQGEIESNDVAINVSPHPLVHYSR